MAALFARVPTINSSHEGPLVNVITLIATVTAGLTVLTVLGSKLAWSRKFGVDDILLSSSLAVAIAETIAVTSAVNDGLGDQTSSLTSSQIAGFEKSTYAAQILYIVTLFLAKASTLAVLFRLTPQKVHRKIILCIGVLTSLWAVSTTVVTAFECTLPSPWNFGSGKCIDLTAFWSAVGVVDIITDLAIIAIPVMILFNVQLQFAKKVAVVFAFSIRVLAIVAVVFRLAYVHRAFGQNSKNFTFEVWPYVVATQLQICFAIIASCAPHLRPFMESLQGGYLSGIMPDGGSSSPQDRSRAAYGYGTKASAQGTRLSYRDKNPELGMATFNPGKSAMARVSETDDSTEGHPHTRDGSKDLMVIKQTKEWTVEYEQGPGPEVRNNIRPFD